MRYWLVILILLVTSLGVYAYEDMSDVVIPQSQKIELPFTWGTDDLFYLSVRDALGNMQWDVRNWRTIVYDDGYTLEQLNDMEFTPGRSTVLMDKDQHGNMLMVCHSGLLDQLPLQCEQLREQIEPIDTFWLEEFPTPEKEAELNSIRQTNMSALIGWQIRMLQGNAPDQKFEVVGISYIPHDQVEEFRSDTKKVHDIMQQNASNPQPWEEAIDAPEQYVILVFCGWGPYTPETEHEWGSWTRYGLLLKPISD